MLVPLPWLAEFTPLGGRDGQGVAAALVSVGLEEEAVLGSGLVGPLVSGLVVEAVPEPQKNGKVINWCQVDVGEALGGVRGIVCGAHNFAAGDKVAVALPGAVLPGPFPITARKTYGHMSDGMICSLRELGLGEDHAGIIVLARLGLDPPVGADLIPLLHLDEQTVDVNVTPDRGYCFSIRGVARELSHATGEPFHDPALIATPPPSTDGFAIVVDDAAPIRGRIGCDRFVARIVRGCSAAGPSPDWMQRRLNQSGMRPISLAVDVTNYVMLELGQPLHAYDLGGVAEPIVVRRARVGEHLTTLDGVDRALAPEDLLITDSPAGRLPTSVPTVGEASYGTRVLGLAGVMGGASSEVSDATQDLLIEAAHFDPVSVARSARRHKLSSEAAKRFERGVDPELAPRAVQRVTDLLLEYGGGEADAAVSDIGQPLLPQAIPFDPAYPERLVGVPYGTERVRAILEDIGCTVVTPASPAGLGASGAAGTAPGRGAQAGGGLADVAGGVPGAGAVLGGGAVAGGGLADVAGRVPGAGAWIVVPPSWRPDLTRPVDLVEEVARIAHYDLIPSVLPAAPAGTGLTKSQRLRRSAARSLADFGLVEVLSYPFVGEDTFDALDYPPGDERREAVRLANPLDAAAPLLRTEILQTLLGTLRRNVSRGFPDAGVFEIGSVTAPRRGADGAVAIAAAPLPGTDRRPGVAEVEALNAAVPPQVRHIAGAMVGQREKAGVWGPGRAADWADAVESARVVGRGLHVSVAPRAAQRAPFHPGRCAELKVGELVVGYAGELDPQVVKTLGLPAGAVAFELDLDRMIELAPDLVPAQPVSPQPVAKEDLAFVVDRALPAQDLVDAIRRGAGPFSEDAWVFDTYEGGQIPPDKKSVAVALRLRAPDHTLSPAELAAARLGAVRAAAQACGAELRS
ncbi:MAG: phenylalanine--tRNA ligase subunit beta [Bifidobacteriaceae bacterium]|jgi:phenylalanyl-tRNA synthetase beta chain|nr:phenylalanine--tRNA ligase subunit beta [Bifidobacteriaceae bacterium]